MPMMPAFGRLAPYRTSAEEQFADREPGISAGKTGEGRCVAVAENMAPGWRRYAIGGGWLPSPDPRCGKTSLSVDRSKEKPAPDAGTGTGSIAMCAVPYQAALAVSSLANITRLTLALLMPMIFAISVAPLPSA